jgi:GNAT acetyltransferase-like protein
MTPRYRIEPLAPDESARWDELITPYDTAGVFHRNAWLEFLTVTRGVDFRRWAIREGGQTRGYLCGAIQRKGPFAALGSPLTGWQTPYMGPVVNRDIDFGGVLDALDLLAREENLAVVELANPELPEHVMRAAGYDDKAAWTLLVPLTPGEPAAMWNGLHSKCRNQVRKAQKSGLTIDETESPDIVDEYYDQYTAAMHNRGVPVQYPRNHAHKLFSCLAKADLLFALRARDAAGCVLATGLFPHDQHAAYYWAGASWPDARELCPNDLLQWHLMCLAANHGLTRYDLLGTGHFKSKFGGTPAPWTRWRRFRRPTARWAWHTYELYVAKQRQVAQRLPRLFSSKGAGTQDV